MTKLEKIKQLSIDDCRKMMEHFYDAYPEVKRICASASNALQLLDRKQQQPQTFFSNEIALSMELLELWPDVFMYGEVITKRNGNFLEVKAGRHHMQRFHRERLGKALTNFYFVEDADA